MNKRSEKLDALLNQEVRVEFVDGKVEQGVLIWNEIAAQPPLYLSKQGYYLRSTNKSGYIGFGKSHVSKIEKV